MELTSNDILRLLQELDQWMKLEDCSPVDWVVCGGAALGLQGLQNRPTRDVDVLGRWNGPLSVVGIESFPQSVLACITRVADNHGELAGLGPNWVNLGPCDLAKEGLPEGFASRLKDLRVGEKLMLRLLGRQDLLALKLYAAADELGPGGKFTTPTSKGWHRRLTNSTSRWNGFALAGTSRKNALP
jgi:hypothetical protein